MVGNPVWTARWTGCVITEGHVVCRRSRDCFYGGAAGAAGRTGAQEDGPQQLQQPGQGPMMIIISGTLAGSVIL